MNMRAALCVVLAAGWVSLAQAADTAIYPSLKNDLVALQGKSLKRFDDAQLSGTKYYAIYYSASWCPPCRAFTPKLVEFYNRIKPQNPHFELIFVSSDQTEQDMEKYIKGDKMMWPALSFDKKPTNKVLTSFSGRGIPCLVLVNAEGKVLSHSYEGENYVGPSKVLADIESTLAANPASADAVSAASQPGALPSVSGGLKPGSPQGSNFDDFFKKKK